MPAEQSTVLVTGGAGFVGSHTCKALARAGYRPVVVDDLSQGHAWAVRWGALAPVDILDDAALDAVFDRFRPAAVLHFAALIAAGESVARPLAYYRQNVGGLLAVCAAMRRHGTAHLVFSSTAAVYGDPAYTPLDEAHPLEPINPYGFSKLACERVLRDVAAAHGLRSVALRYFNAAGADPDGELGEAHDPETHLVPLALRAARDPAFTLTVFGTDYDTPDGTAVRDYVHVADLAEAHVRALAYLRAGGATTACNLGTGRGYSVLEVIEAVERALGRPVKRRLGERRPGDPPVLVAAAGRAGERLGWRAASSDLATIVDTAARWRPPSAS